MTKQEIKSVKQRVEVISLLKQRDTLITALRECVVALEGVFSGLSGNTHWTTESQNAWYKGRSALTNAKSLLERYK